MVASSLIPLMVPSAATILLLRNIERFLITSALLLEHRLDLHWCEEEGQLRTVGCPHNTLHKLLIEDQLFIQRSLCTDRVRAIQLQNGTQKRFLSARHIIGRLHLTLLCEMKDQKLVTALGNWAVYSEDDQFVGL